MASSSQLRRINQRKVIRVMLRLRSASRVQLAKETGISQATVGRIVDDLIGDAVMAEASPGRGIRDLVQIGRPSTTLELDRYRRRFLAIHVGVHQTRLAALPLSVGRSDEWTVHLPTPQSPEQWLKSVGAHWDGVAASGMKAVILSLPGVVDERRGQVLLSPNLRWTERADLPAMIRSLAGDVPVLFVQEIRALALGQHAAVPDVDDFLLADFGTGVGAAAVIGGKPYRGPLPLSGELGHTPVVESRRRCGCGQVGCVETLLSRDGLLTSSRAGGGPQNWQALSAELGTGELPQWIIPTLDAAALTVAGALNVLGLDHLVLTGTPAEFPSIGSYLGDQITRGTMWAEFGKVTCTLAPRRRIQGLVTAAINDLLLSEIH